MSRCLPDIPEVVYSSTSRDERDWEIRYISEAVSEQQEKEDQTFLLPKLRSRSHASANASDEGMALDWLCHVLLFRSEVACNFAKEVWKTRWFPHKWEWMQG